MLQAEKRGQRRRVEPSLPGGSLAVLYSQLGCSTSTPSRRASQLEAWTHLEQAISKLPDTYRTVVEMYDLAEQSAEEVAAAVHRSPGAVFMLRARAHRQLGDIMGAASMFFSGAR
jgi:DNA-directed RNA polymerase specialized sigma24 family protein